MHNPGVSVETDRLISAKPSSPQEAQVEQVSFRSTDGKSTITGYLFKPASAPANDAAVNTTNAPASSTQLAR